MNSITSILISLPAILIALTFHEYAHGKAAYFLGDDTPYYQGRLTLNPIPHIDWIGFAMLLFFSFGWAKPVQVNPGNFKNVTYKKGMMLVSIAGPAMNLLLAFLGMVALKLVLPYQFTEWGSITLAILRPLIIINIILAAFNLIPVPPLDGSKILAGLLPDSGSRLMYSLEQYGPLLLLLLIISNGASAVFWPVANYIYQLFYSVVF